MQSPSKRRILQYLVLAGIPPVLLAAQATAHAQSIQTVRFLIGFPAGGGPDLVARLVAEQVRASRAWTTVVENRPGASGRIAIGALRSAVPEPLTLLVSPIEILTLLPHLYRNVGYDPFDDVMPIAALVETPYAIAVSGRSDFKTLNDLVQWCRSNPERANYGTPGEGTPQHLLGQVFAREAGIQLTHIAYKGGPPAIQDVIGGQIPAVIATYSALASYRASGVLRVLAHSGRAHTPLIDGVPLFAESGYPGVVAESSFLVFAGSGVHREAAAKVAQAIAQHVSSEEFARGAAKMGLKPLTLSDGELRRLMRENYAFWQKATATPGFKMLD